MGTRYTFERCTFDAAQGVLELETHVRPLRPRTAAVLEQLLRRPRQVLTKDDLLRAVWEGRVVTENSLDQCLSELRKALGRQHGRLVKTVPRRGYMLEADVEASKGSAPVPAGTRWMAVLPLQALDEEPMSRRFAERLAFDLGAEIGRTQCVSVVTASVAGSRVASDLRDVDYVVDGQVRRLGVGIEVSISVSDPGTSLQVWSQRFAADPLRADEEAASIAGRTASMLSAELTAIEHARGLRPASVREMLKRAYFLWQRALPELSQDALALAKQARVMDPDFAGAHTFIAYWQVSGLATRAIPWSASAVAKAEAAARRGLALDPLHRLAHGALGAALACGAKLEEALVALVRQLELNPHVPGAHQWLGTVHMLRGEPGLAIPAFEAALALGSRDTRRSAFLEALAMAHLHHGDDSRGLELAVQACREPRLFPRALETLALAYAVNGRRDDARDAWERLLVLWPGYSTARHRKESMSSEPRFLERRERMLGALERFTTVPRR